MGEPTDARHHEIDRLRERVTQLDSTRRSLESALASVEREIAHFTAAGVSANGGGPAAPAASNRCAILMYHRVNRHDLDPYKLCVTPEAFRTQMEFIARTCDPVSLDTLVAGIRSGGLPRRGVCLTFDDGYLDALTASDILRRLHLPATFFLNSYFGEEGLHDLVARIFLGDHALPEVLSLAVEASAVPLPTSSVKQRYAAFDAVREISWSLSAEGRDELRRALIAWSGVDANPRDTHRTMIADEIRELASRPHHEIGGHTDHHLFLPSHSREIKIREMVDNQILLEELIGRAITSLAFPYGAYDAECVDICRGMGLRAAVTVEPRSVCAWDDLVRLPRHEVTPAAAANFESFIDGLFS